MLWSFACVCTLAPGGAAFTQPDFSDTLAIKQGRHPILLDKMAAAEVVGNNTVCLQLRVGSRGRSS